MGNCGGGCFKEGQHEAAQLETLQMNSKPNAASFHDNLETTSVPMKNAESHTLRAEAEVPSSNQTGQLSTNPTMDPNLGHIPPAKFARPLTNEPNYLNHVTSETLKKRGPFKPEQADLQGIQEETVTLPPYEMENGSVYTGQWRLGLRHGFGKQMWKDGSIYEGFWKDNKVIEA